MNEAVIRSIDGIHCVLVFSDGQVLRWPSALLPSTAKAGDTVRLSLEAQAPAKQEADSSLAHAVLNEIFAAGN